MKPGQALDLSLKDLRDCASGMLDSLLFDSVRDSDIKEFIKRIEPNWGVELVERPDGNFTIYKKTNA
jgi:hypothetical protein